MELVNSALHYLKIIITKSIGGLRDKLSEATVSIRQRYNHFSNSLQSDYNKFMNYHLPAVKFNSISSVIWILAVCVIIIRYFFFLFAAIIILRFSFRVQQHIHPITEIIAGAALIIPLSRITSSIFVTYVYAFKVVKNKGSSFLSKRAPPYSQDRTDQSLSRAEIDQDRISDKNTSWWFYTNICTILFLAILIAVSSDVIESIPSETVVNVGSMLVDIIRFLFPFNIIIYVLNEISGIDEETLARITVAVFIPALFYSIPMVNHIAIMRSRVRQMINDHKDGNLFDKISFILGAIMMVAMAVVFVLVFIHSLS